VPGLDDVRLPLADLLATLHGDDLAEFLGPLAEFVVDLPQHLGTVDVGHRAPLLEGRLGGVDGPLDVGLGPADERAQRLARGGVLAGERLLAGPVGPLAVDVVAVDLGCLLAHILGETGHRQKPSASPESNPGSANLA